MYEGSLGKVEESDRKCCFQIKNLKNQHDLCFSRKTMNRKSNAGLDSFM